MLVTTVVSLIAGYDMAIGPVGSSSVLKLRIEERLGLNLLYLLRPNRAPPEDVIIVTPNRDAGEKLDQPSKLREWDRRKHAEVIEMLQSLEVSTIAIDIEFYKYREDKQEDEALANAIASAGNIVLVQEFLTREISEKTKLGILRNPIGEFSKNALTLAPFKLFKESGQLNRFEPFLKVVAHDTDDICNGYLSDSDLIDKHLDNLGDNIAANDIPILPIATLITHLRLNQNNDEGSDRFLASNLARYLSCWNSPKKNSISSVITSTHNTSINSNRAQTALSDLLKESHELRFINYYGPSRSVYTIDYREFVDSEYDNQRFKGAIVFIGVSDIDGEDQRDIISTPVDKGGVQLSGVEIAATIFANAWTDSFIRPAGGALTMLISLIAGLLLALASKIDRLFTSISVCISLVLGYLLLSVVLLLFKSFWLPVFLPAIALPVFFIATEVLTRYKSERTKREDLEEKIGKFVKEHPDDLGVQTLFTAAYPEIKERETQGACLITDVQGFSAVAEQLGHTETYKRTKEYFLQLNRCVTQNGGKIYLIDGDSLTGVWDSQFDLPTACARARQAGIDMLEEVSKFNTKYKDYPFVTRIGLDAGKFLIGGIGSEEYRSIAVVGDTIYTASRLEQLNKKIHQVLKRDIQTKFLATENVAKEIENFSGENLGVIPLDGMKKQLKIYKIA